MYRKWQTRGGVFLYYIISIQCTLSLFQSGFTHEQSTFLVCACPVCAQQKLLRMGSASWGAECSDHGTSTGCNNLREGAEWELAQGWPAWECGVDLEEMYLRTALVPGEILWAATGQFWHRAGEWSERLTLSSAPLAWPWPNFPVGHPENCHPLSPGNDFPYTWHSSATGMFHSWLRSQGCWPLLNSLVCNQ